MVVPAPPASVSQDELNAILGDALPRQGFWTDDDYLWLTDRSRRMIADPRPGTITVLSLRGDTYAEHGVYERGGLARSALLPGFSAPMSEVFAAAESIA